MWDPKPVSNTGPLVTSPKPTSVAGLSTTTPAFLGPIITRIIQYLRLHLTSWVEYCCDNILTWECHNPINTSPATNTAANACWISITHSRITPNVKNALSPIPGC